MGAIQAIYRHEYEIDQGMFSMSNAKNELIKSVFHEYVHAAGVKLDALNGGYRGYPSSPERWSDYTFHYEIIALDPHNYSLRDMVMFYKIWQRYGSRGCPKISEWAP